MRIAEIGIGVDNGAGDGEFAGVIFVLVFTIFCCWADVDKKLVENSRYIKQIPAKRERYIIFLRNIIISILQQ